MPIQITPFRDEFLPLAASLLAARHRRDRATLPILPARFEDANVARQAIEAVLAKPRAAGFAAMDGGDLIAYLIGDMSIDSQRGRSGWVRSPGCAFHQPTGSEVVRDLYAALGAMWVTKGVFSHFALLPTTDPALLQAWFSLSFGIEQVHALLNLRRFDPMAEPVSDIELRLAGPGDADHLASMSDVIWRQQVESPVWGAMLPETVAEVEEGWTELVDDADYVTWLAMAGEEPVGVQVYWSAEASDELLHIPDQCVYLGVAGTRTHFRNRGIGTLMTSNGLAQAAAAGYEICETDWRSTNLFSSRFWPRRGFQPAVYRLVRNIDPRITWATGASSGG